MLRLTKLGPDFAEMRCEKRFGWKPGGGHARSAQLARCGGLLDTTRCTDMPYDSTTKTAPKGRAKPKRAVLPEREDRWEGFLKGETGPARKARFVIQCRLSFLAGRVIGSGSSPEYPYDTDQNGRQFTLNGERTSDHLALVLQFSAGHVSQSAFHLTGQIDAEERFISGSWTWQCTRCICGGATGHFELLRIKAS